MERATLTVRLQVADGSGSDQLRGLLNAMWLLLPTTYFWTQEFKLGNTTLPVWVEVYLVLHGVQRCGVGGDPPCIPFAGWNEASPCGLSPGILGSDPDPLGTYFDIVRMYEEHSARKKAAAPTYSEAPAAQPTYSEKLSAATSSKKRCAVPPHGRAARARLHACLTTRLSSRRASECDAQLYGGSGSVGHVQAFGQVRAHGQCWGLDRTPPGGFAPGGMYCAASDASPTRDDWLSSLGLDSASAQSFLPLFEVPDPLFEVRITPPPPCHPFRAACAKSIG